MTRPGSGTPRREPRACRLCTSGPAPGLTTSPRQTAHPQPGPNNPSGQLHACAAPGPRRARAPRLPRLATRRTSSCLARARQESPPRHWHWLRDAGEARLASPPPVAVRPLCSPHAAPASRIAAASAGLHAPHGPTFPKHAPPACRTPVLAVRCLALRTRADREAYCLCPTHSTHCYRRCLAPASLARTPPKSSRPTSLRRVVIEFG